MLDHTNQKVQHSTPSTQHLVGPWQVLVESDLLNVLILALAIVYLGNKFLPKIIDERKKQISKELEEAKNARIKATKELEEIQEKTKNILSEVDSIKKEAEKSALTLKKQAELETEKELEGLKLKIKREIISSQDEVLQKYGFLFSF